MEYQSPRQLLVLMTYWKNSLYWDTKVITLLNTRSANFCADQIDIITNFAVITNVHIKRVHCIRL